MAMNLTTAVEDFWIARTRGEFFRRPVSTGLRLRGPIASKSPWSTAGSPPASDVSPRNRSEDQAIVSTTPPSTRKAAPVAADA